jgi:ElaB/YqjD/DUF883 family membrane-anchored ribosome-binding protein
VETTVRGSNPLNSEISNSAAGAVNRASSSAHAAVNSLAGAADEAARKAKPAIDRVAAMAHQAVDKAAGAAAPTADWLTERGQRLNATQEKLVAGASNYVSANPLKALGIALAAGFLLSRFIR